jgi:magnesium transporter
LTNAATANCSSSANLVFSDDNEGLEMLFSKTIKIPVESPVYVGDRPAEEMDLSIITYDETSAEYIKLSNIDELTKYRVGSKKLWINISGLKNIDSIRTLGKLYDIHPLTVEDILNTEQQPKVEIFENYRFLSIKTIQHEKEFHHEQDKRKKRFFLFKKEEEKLEEFLIDQVSIIIMKNTLITFQEITGDSFDGIREKILTGAGEIRKMEMDFLSYEIIDAVVDEYFLALNHLEEDIEDFEDRATKTSDDMFIQELQDTKKYLLQIKRAISPLKDNVSVILKQNKFFLTEELKPFTQNLLENLHNAENTVEHYREWLSNIMDVNLSVLSHQTNKVMKVLAVISTIFIPLTFVAGVYGMNFEFMPELRQPWGYPLVLGCMGFIALSMVIIFKTRRWF